jgi:DNA-binding Lrp family transcriptional regulator
MELPVLGAGAPWARTRRRVMGECTDTVAFVLIKTELGAAAQVAAAVSRLNVEVEGDKGVEVRGVRWATIVTGPYDVMAAVRVKNNEALTRLVIQEIQPTEGIRNPLTIVSGGWFVNGERIGLNGYP